MKRRTVMLALSALALSFPAAAQQVTQPRGGPPGAWRLIGTTQAKSTIDHDSIHVAGPYDNFRAIKFKVTNAPLNLYRLVVTYDAGASDHIEVRQNVPQGGESRVIDLRGVGKPACARSSSGTTPRVS